MTSILSRLLTADKPWSIPYQISQVTTTLPAYRSQVSSPHGMVPIGEPPTNQQSLVRVSSSSSSPPPPPQSKRRGPRKSNSNSVRFGRVPKREKAKILAAMQKVNASSQEKALCSELEDELRLLTTIVHAHEETSVYTKEKIAPLLENARTHPVYTTCTSKMRCPLNPVPSHIEAEHHQLLFSERFAPAIQGVVEFAKRIPGFSFLSQDDQITLLKAGVFEVLLVRLACMFDPQANSLVCLNGEVLHRESLHAANNARFLMDSMFDFTERFNALRLSDPEVGLFCASVVISPDRPGLRSVEFVSKIQKKLLDLLQKSVNSSHPENPSIMGDLMKKIPDLRTLNTLHSEKLLAYKTEPVNQTPVSSSNMGMNGVRHAPVINPSIYATIPHEVWSQYSLVTTHPQCLATEEDNRSTSSPGQQSHSSGSSTGSEWSTTDSTKDDLIGSPRSVGSGGSGGSVEDVKSPPRTSSFSSSRSYVNEDMWPPEAQPNGEFLNIKRKPDNSSGSDHGSSSGDECYYIDSPMKVPVYPKLRRVDSPTDSGIESGKEHGSSTTPTISNCSSPRSALDEKVKDIMDQEQEKQSQIEDMPVLKRALQAPPLVNTNMLMDEAYRHHKKFRAARRDAESPSSLGLSLASTHSTLVRTLEQAPRYLSEQQLKRTDLIHNIIMRTETLPGQQTHHHQSHPSHTDIPVSQHPGTNNIQVSVCNVPVSSPVSPNYAPNAQQKNMLVCPSGYYIPHAAPMYSTSPVQWPFSGGLSTSSTVASTTTVTHSPVQSHFTSEHSHIHNGQVQQSNTPLCSSVVTNSTHSVSPSLMYNCRPSSGSSSPLVMNGGLPSAPSPSGLTSSLCQLETRLMSPSPPQQHQISSNEGGESQPLNLSKKLFAPRMLKMES